MECYDGAEVCELVGFFQLKHDVNKESIRFYSDNGLGIFPNIPKPELKESQEIQRIWIIYHHSVQLDIGGLFRCYF